MVQALYPSSSVLGTGDSSYPLTPRLTFGAGRDILLDAFIRNSISSPSGSEPRGTVGHNLQTVLLALFGDAPDIPQAISLMKNPHDFGHEAQTVKQAASIFTRLSRYHNVPTPGTTTFQEETQESTDHSRTSLVLQSNQAQKLRVIIGNLREANSLITEQIGELETRTQLEQAEKLREDIANLKAATDLTVEQVEALEKI